VITTKWHALTADAGIGPRKDAESGHAAARKLDVRHGFASNGDIDMWLLSHLMRDAETNSHVDVAERKYGVWLQTLAP
jgi:hypothetical protein